MPVRPVPPEGLPAQSRNAVIAVTAIPGLCSDPIRRLKRSNMRHFGELTALLAGSGHHGRMLSSARAVAFVPSTDLERSREFYEGVLGLSVVNADSFAVVLQAGATTVRITLVGASLQVQPFTVLGWEVADVHAAIRALVEQGVKFLQVDGVEQDGAGVWTAPDGTQVAWFRDPDGNTLSLSRI